MSLKDCLQYFKLFNDLPFAGEVHKLTSSFFNFDFHFRVICLKKTQYGHIVYVEDQISKRTLKFFSNTKLKKVIKTLDQKEKGEYIITTPIYIRPLEMGEYNEFTYRKLDIHH